MEGQSGLLINWMQAEQRQSQPRRRQQVQVNLMECEPAQPSARNSISSQCSASSYSCRRVPGIHCARAAVKHSWNMFQPPGSPFPRPRALAGPGGSGAALSASPASGGWAGSGGSGMPTPPRGPPVADDLDSLDMLLGGGYSPSIAKCEWRWLGWWCAQSARD